MRTIKAYVCIHPPGEAQTKKKKILKNKQQIRTDRLTNERYWLTAGSSNDKINI